MKLIKITFFLLFSLLLYGLPSTAQPKSSIKNNHSYHSTNIKIFEHEHIIEQYLNYRQENSVQAHPRHNQNNNHYQQHQQHDHHGHHDHEEGVEICPHCGHAHNVEVHMVRYEMLDAKFALLKHKALLFFILAFCLFIYNWTFKKKLKRG